MKTTFQRIGIATLLCMAIVTSSYASLLRSETIKETRDFNGYTAIGLSISADVYITQGSGFSFVIEGEKDHLDRIVTEIKGKTLIIRTERYNFKSFTSKVKIYITMPEVEELLLAGSGNIKCITPLVAKDLSVKVSGSGNIIIPNLTLSSLYAAISGSGDIDISGQGSAVETTIKIAGSGDVTVKGVKFKNSEISISGSGNTYVESTENLKARVAGSGNVIYSGNPLIDAKISGSGKIKNR